MVRNGLKSSNKREDASVSATLASAMEEAARTARTVEATRWGTRVLWAGAALVGTSAWLLKQGAETVGRNVASVFLAAVCVALWSAWKIKLGAKGGRTSATAAARRLERRFPEQKGVLVAAVDFCEEESGDRDEAMDETTSAALRVATVAAATRWLEEIAAKLDGAEWRAVLTDLPLERFQKFKIKRRVCALGVLANLAIWGGASVEEERRVEQKPNACWLETQGVKTATEIARNKQNEQIGQEKGNEEIKEEGEEAGNSQGSENDAANETEKNGADEEISLAALELLISELAQNSAIAESLRTELENAVDDKTGASEKDESPRDATRFLQLARELKANLARPKTGLIAQTRRLSAAGERERQKIEARLNAAREKEIGGEVDKIGEIEEIRENGGEFVRSERRITGKEIAVLLTSARLAELETKLTAAGGVGDWTALAISRVLRCDSAEEREKILTQAAARVGEWETTLRREETAARVLSESWRFDATSQLWATLAKRASQENRTLLTRFAGRLSVGREAPDGENEALEEAKRRFNALWEEARRAEKEGVAIVERLRERLQSEEAQTFVDFAQKNETLKGWELGGDETDEAFDEALATAVTQGEKKWTKIAANVENNRFGRAAERLENVGATFLETPSSVRCERGALEEGKEKSRSEVGLSVEIKEVEGSRDDETAEDGGVEERRFSALAALLTLGVDENSSLQREKRPMKNERDALSTIERKDGKASQEANRKIEERGASAKNKEKAETLEARKNGLESGPKERNGEEKGRTAEEETAVATTTSEQNESSEGPSGDFESGELATSDETGSENGANAGDVSDLNEAKREKRNALEPDENKAFNAELPSEARRRFEETSAPEILPEYAEKIRLYRRRISERRR